MNRKVFIDTNILLDACMGERPGWAHAVMLLDEIAYGRLEGLIAATSLKDAYYVLTKYSEERTAREFILAALDAFTVIEIDTPLCRMAALSDEPDFEDALIRAGAERANADFIISRDEKAFTKSRLKRLSAQDYVSIFCPSEEIALPQ